jgi:hypothetical protein
MLPPPPRPHFRRVSKPGINSNSLVKFLVSPKREIKVFKEGRTVFIGTLHAGGF